jgi:hypothetical protein
MHDQLLHDILSVKQQGVGKTPVVFLTNKIGNRVKLNKEVDGKIMG